MEKTGYNGWTNYETWNCALWIDNDEGSYDYWRDQAREVYRQTEAEDDNRVGDAAGKLADILASEIKDNAPEVDGFYGDILTAAISEVNWYEIAEHWIEEIKDDEE